MEESNTNMISRITNLESQLKISNILINSQHTKIAELTKKIQIQYENDDLIKTLDDKLFTLRTDFRQIQKENETLLEKIIQLESNKKID